jgi:hypothetical protein
MVKCGVLFEVRTEFLNIIRLQRFKAATFLSLFIPAYEHLRVAECVLLFLLEIAFTADGICKWKGAVRNE